MTVRSSLDEALKTGDSSTEFIEVTEERVAISLKVFAVTNHAAN